MPFGPGQNNVGAGGMINMSSPYQQIPAIGVSGGQNIGTSSGGSLGVSSGGGYNVGGSYGVSGGASAGASSGTSSGSSQQGSQQNTQILPGLMGIYNQTLGLNQQNYQNVLGAYSQGQGNLQNNLPGVYGGYSGILGGIRNTLGQGGSWGVATPAAQAIGRTFDQARGATTQQMTNAGLGNTTVGGNLQNQNAMMAGQAYGNLGAQLAQQYAGYESQVGLAGQAARMQGLGMQTGLYGQAGGALAGYSGFQNHAGNLTGNFGSSYGTSQNQAQNQAQNAAWNQAQNQSFNQGQNWNNAFNQSQNQSNTQGNNFGTNVGGYAVPGQQGPGGQGGPGGMGSGYTNLGGGTPYAGATINQGGGQGWTIDGGGWNDPYGQAGSGMYGGMGNDAQPYDPALNAGGYPIY